MTTADSTRNPCSEDSVGVLTLVPGKLYRVRNTMRALGDNGRFWAQSGQVFMFLRTTDYVYHVNYHARRPSHEVRLKDYFIHVLLDEKRICFERFETNLQDFVWEQFESCPASPSS